MRAARHSVVGLSLVLACAPLVDAPEAESTGSSETSPHSASSAASPETATNAIEGSGAAASTTDEVVDDGPGVPDVPNEPPDPPPSICDDPYAVTGAAASPYQYCLRGLVDFTVSSSIAIGEGFDAYAQFYTVNAESQIVWEEEILDPFEGVGDCSLRYYGNSGTGEGEDVIWEDAGDLTFVLADDQLPADEYGDPVSVIGYQASPRDFGIEPAFLGRYGIVATGDTTPAFDLPDAVTMPDLVEVLEPALDGSAVAHEDLVFRWTPSAAGVPLDINVHVQPPGWDYTVFCRVDDDGEFAFPIELTEQLPLPSSAYVYIRRADVRIVGFDGERGILATASTVTDGNIHLQ